MFEHYLEHDRWATTAEEFGYEKRVYYPDGGYYELEADGEIAPPILPAACR